MPYYSLDQSLYYYPMAHTEVPIVTYAVSCTFLLYLITILAKYCRIHKRHCHYSVPWLSILTAIALDCQGIQRCNCSVVLLIFDQKYFNTSKPEYWEWTDKAKMVLKVHGYKWIFC